MWWCGVHVFNCAVFVCALVPCFMTWAVGFHQSGRSMFCLFVCFGGSEVLVSWYIMIWSTSDLRWFDDELLHPEVFENVMTVNIGHFSNISHSCMKHHITGVTWMLTRHLRRVRQTAAYVSGYMSVLRRFATAWGHNLAARPKTPSCYALWVGSTAGGKWTTYRQMAEETVNRAVCVACLKVSRGCSTKGLLLDGAHGWSPTLFIRLVQDFGVESKARCLFPVLNNHFFSCACNGGTVRFFRNEQPVAPRWLQTICFINSTPIWHLGNLASMEASIDYTALRI